MSPHKPCSALSNIDAFELISAKHGVFLPFPLMVTEGSIILTPWGVGFAKFCLLETPLGLNKPTQEREIEQGMNSIS